MYSALHLVTGRRVAIKRLLPGLGDAEQARTRFLREARIAAQLSHPNLVTVHDVGEHGGAIFVVMEQLRGETLSARMRRAPLAPAEAVEIVRGMLRGLIVARRAHVLHRDILPVFLVAPTPRLNPPRPRSLDAISGAVH